MPDLHFLAALVLLAVTGVSIAAAVCSIAEALVRRRQAAHWRARYNAMRRQAVAYRRTA